MKGSRAAATVLLILVWAVFVPAVMVADHCAAMNYMCEGPCGASAPSAAPAVPVFTGFVGHTNPTPALAVPQSEPRALEPPPKSPALSA